MLRTGRLDLKAQQVSFQEQSLDAAEPKQNYSQPAAFCKHLKPSHGLGGKFSGAKPDFWADNNLHVI